MPTVTSLDQLPDYRGATNLYMDFETTSFDPAVGAINPYQGDRICGVCVTADDDPTAYYVPIRHQLEVDKPRNLNPDNVMRWVGDLIYSAKNWVNHNVKFDAHFSAVEGYEFGPYTRLVDTLTLSKLLDSDRTFSGGYGLKALSPDWLEENIAHREDAVKQFLSGIRLARNKKAKDYGHVSIDVLGPYGEQDVITNRKLYKNLLRRKPADAADVWETEILLTPVLYDIERLGMRVDPLELIASELQITTQLIRIEQWIEETTGTVCTPSNTSQCFDLLCNHYGLPVLKRNEESGNPSFDKFAMQEYIAHPEVTKYPDRFEVVSKMLEYRKLQTLLTFFIQPYQEHEVNGILHPTYNQCVSSGRMSSRRPNAQQLSKKAKQLIKPFEGEAFLSCDYSQVEFRLIVHYTRSQSAIAAFQNDPFTDFHTWVAEMCGVPRKHAKNINFAIGYGAGKKKVTSMLAGNMELMEDLQRKIDTMQIKNPADRPKIFQRLCEERAEEVFKKYHDALPGLRTSTKQAQRKIEARNYVRNAYGRHSHLKSEFSHVAFNRLVQSCAADIAKNRMLALAPRYNSEIRNLGLRIAGQVHDEFLFMGPTEVTRDPATIWKIVQIMEDTGDRFNVPIRTSAGWSDENWAIASGDDGELDAATYRRDL